MSSADVQVSPDQQAKFAEAEKIFSAAGFMLRALPVLLILNAAILFIPIVIYGDGTAMLAIAMCLLGGCAFPAFTFINAAGTHAGFKARFGSAYVKLVADGAVPLNVGAILSGLSPAGYEHRIESAAKNAVKSAPL